MMALLSDENGTRVGGTLSIHRDSGSIGKEMNANSIAKHS
jgi:hypothetical protein